MKKITILGVILGCVASFSANSALITSSTDSALDGATVETFNSIGLGEYGSLSVSGATIVGHGGDMSVSNNSSSIYGVDGYTLQNIGSTPSSFSIIFDTAVDAFGIWGGAYNSGWTFSAYDSLDNLIESVSASTSCCSPMFLGLVNDDMAKVTLSSNSRDWVVFDNLTYKESVSAVPIPAAVFMFVPALLGFLGFRRKLQA